MLRTITTLLLLATFALANTNPSKPRVHTLDNGQQFYLFERQQQASTPARHPHHSLDQGGEDCLTANPIPNLPFCDAGTTVGYVDDYYEYCAESPGSPDVVYSFISTSDRQISISLLGSGFNTHLQVYETDTDCSGMWYYDCNGDYSGTESCLEGMYVWTGYTYYIIVDGENGEAGNYILNVAEGLICPSTICSPGGDTCEDPMVITALPYCDNRDTGQYTDDYTPACVGVTFGEFDVVYKYIPTQDLFLGITTASPVFATTVEIWESQSGCDGAYLLGCTNLYDGLTACITGVDVYVGYQYYIYVDGLNGGYGPYTLNVYQGGGCSYNECSGGNGEDCATAITVPSMNPSVTLTGTTEGFADNYSECEESPSPDIVYSYTPTYTHQANILSDFTLFNSTLTIYRDGALISNCETNALYWCNELNCYSNAELYCVDFEVGHSYCIILGGRNTSDFGSYQLVLEETVDEPCVLNELCDFQNTETEPNGDCELQQIDPFILVAGDTVAGTICNAGDKDYYRIALTEDHAVAVTVRSGELCDEGFTHVGISYYYPEFCVEGAACNNCGWLYNCGPETVAVVVKGLGDCYTGKYIIYVEPWLVYPDACDPVACVTAAEIECGVQTVVNTCDGCSSPICQIHKNGCSGPRTYTGPQKFYRIDVPATADYTFDVSTVDTTGDAQFSIFTDCISPRSTCVFSQDQNSWFDHPTGARNEEHGTVSLNPGTYYLHVSGAWGTCGDIIVLVNCQAACLPPDSVTVKWTTSNVAEIRFISDGGTYQFYSTDIPNNDHDPRGGDPQWTLRDTQNYGPGASLWTDATPSSAYRNYVVLKSCP